MAKVRIFENPHFTGRCQELALGRFAQSELQFRPLSIEVPPGWKVTLWWEPTFSGGSRMVWETIANLDTVGWGRAASAIAVSPAASESTVEVARSVALVGYQGDGGAYFDIGPIDFDWNGGFQGLTIESWVYFDSTGRWQRIADIFHRVGWDNIVFSRHGDGTGLALHVVRNGHWSGFITAGVIMNSSWMHVAATVEPGGMGRIYVNGVEVASGQLHVPEQMTRGSGLVGKSPFGDDDWYYAGQLAEMRLWSVARTAEEIARGMTTRCDGREQGLIRYYRFDDLAGGTIKDHTGMRDATAHNLVLFGLAGPILRDATTYALQIDDATRGVHLPPMATDLSAGFTIEAWVYFDGVQSFSRIVDLGNGPGVDTVLFARREVSNDLYVHIFNGSADGVAVASNVLQSGTWMHLAATFGDVQGDGKGLLTIYVNGSPRGSNRIPSPSRAVRHRAYIGRSNWDTDPPFHGKLAEVRIWTRARSQDELLATMHTQLDPTAPGLAAYYPLDEVGATLAHDATPGAQHGTLYSGVTWTPGGPAALVPTRGPAAGLVFNGADTYVELPPCYGDFTQGMTIEAWVYHSAASSFGRIVDLGNGPESDNILFARSDTSNSLYIHVFRGGVSGYAVADDVLQLDTWQHLAVTLSDPAGDGTCLATIYVNGEARKSNRVTTPGGLLRRKSYIGKSNWPDPLFQGRMAELRLWTVARSPAELRSSMAGKLTGNEFGLLRYHPLDGGSAEVVLDRATPQGIPNPADQAGTLRGAGARFVLPPLGQAPRTTSATALWFDGSRTVVELPALDADFSAGFTFEAWIDFDWGTGGIVELRSADGADAIRFVRVRPDGGTATYLQLTVRRAGQVMVCWTGMFAPALAHVAVTIDGAGAPSLHVDGVPQPLHGVHGTSFVPRAGVVWSRAVLGMGADRDIPYLGRMAEVRLWKRARTTAELRASRTISLLETDAALVAYYRLDETEGCAARDLAGRGLHGVVRGLRPIWGSGGPAVAPPPSMLGALDFGSAGWVDLPAVTADFSQGFTIEVWVYVVGVDAWASILDLGNGRDTQNIVMGRHGDKTDLYVHVINGTSHGAVVAPGVLRLGTWLHLAATLGGPGGDGMGPLTLHVNGVAVASGRVPMPLHVTRGRCYLGRSGWPVAPFKASAAELRVWTVARTATELRRTMNARLAGNEPGLYACYRLNERTGTRAADATPRGRHGWLRGTTSWDQRDPLPSFAPAHAVPGALRLDGAGHVEAPLLAPPAGQSLPRGITLEAWVYCADVSRSAAFIAMGNPATAADAVSLGHVGTALVLGVQSRTQPVQVITAAGALAQDEWTHVAATVDEDGHVALYKNGAVVTLDRYSVTPPPLVIRKTVYLGRSLDGALFCGRITEARIWSTPRTPGEIAATRAVRLNAVPGLARCYPLWSAHGDIAVDTGAGRQDGRVYGWPAVGWDAPGPDALGVRLMQGTGSARQPGQTTGNRASMLANTCASSPEAALNSMAGSAALVQPPPPSPEALTGAEALEFDGISTYVRLPELSIDLSRGFTIEAWVHASSSSLFGRIVDLGNGPGIDTILFARSGTSNSLYLHVFRDGVANYVVADDVLRNNTWQHLAVTLGDPAGDGTGLATIYVNGEARASGRVPLPGKVVRRLCFIGRSNWSTDPSFHGRMAEVRVWTVARTQAELTATMHTRLHGTEPGLAAAYALHEGTGSQARDAARRVGDATVRGARRAAAGPLQVFASPPAPRAPVPVTARTLSTAVPTAGDAAPVSVGAGQSVTVGDPVIDAALAGYASTGISFSLLGVPVSLRFTGAVTVLPHANPVTLTSSFALFVPGRYDIATATLAIDRGSNPVVFSVRFAPNFSVADMVQAAVEPTPVWPVVNALLMPFLRLFDGAVILVANSDGHDATLGDFGRGLNLYVQKPASALPGLDEVHRALPMLHLDSLPLTLWLALRSATDFQLTGTTRIGATLIDSSAVKLVFEEIGVNLGFGTGSLMLGITHRFTLTLFGERLAFRGGFSVEKGTTGEAIGVWGALDPGVVWKNPGDLKILSIGGLGIQLKATPEPPFIGFGVRGEVYLGDALLGGSIALSVDPANWDKTILVVDSPGGLQLASLLRAFLLAMPDAPEGLARAAELSSLRLTAVKFYFAPNGGSIAGKSYAPGITIGATLTWWGYSASIYGCLDPVRGGSLRGQAERLRIAVGDLILFQLSDASGNFGPEVGVELNTSQQGVFYSGRLILLGGVRDSFEQLRVTSYGISYTCGTVLGTLALQLDLRSAALALTVRPSFRYSFKVLGFTVSVGILGLVSHHLELSRYRQEVAFFFSFSGINYSVGPVVWEQPLLDPQDVAAAFDHLFGDVLKRFFTASLADAARAAFDWVAGNVTPVAEEAAALFRSAGADTAAIAQGLSTSFGVEAGRAVALAGASLQQAASILHNTFHYSAEQTARAMQSAFDASAALIMNTMGVAGYTAGELKHMAETIGGAFEDAWDSFTDLLGL